MEKSPENLPKKKIGRKGEALLAAMRAYSPEQQAELESHVVRLYTEHELHEVSAALYYTAPDEAIKIVSETYEKLTDSFFFELTEDELSPIYKSTNLDGEGKVKSGQIAWLILAPIVIDKTWGEITLPEIRGIANEAASKLKAIVPQFSEWKIDFPGAEAITWSPMFPSKLKLHLLMDLVKHSIHSQWGFESEVLKLSRETELLSYTTNMQDITMKECKVVFSLYGVISKQTLGGEACDLLQNAPWAAEFENEIRTITNSKFDIPINEVSTSYSIQSLDRYGQSAKLASHLRRKLQFASSLRIARERANYEEIVVIATPILLDRKDRRRFEEFQIGIWRKTGPFLYGLAWVVFYDTTSSEIIKTLRDLSVEENFTLIINAPAPRSSVPTTRSGLQYQNQQGIWKDPELALAGDGASLIKSVNWIGLEDEIVDNQNYRQTPLPHRLISAGLIDHIQSHYAPKVYQTLKQLCSDISLSDEDVWMGLEQEFPQFRDLISNAPYAAMPEFPAYWSARLHWSKSPTIVVRQTLNERLIMTDLGLDIESQFLVLPYNFFYLHFEDARSDLQWEENGLVATIEGAFIHQHGSSNAANGRQRIVEIGCMASTDSGEQLFYLDVRLVIEDEGEMLESVMKRTRDMMDPAPDDQWWKFMLSVIEEIVKVMIYLGTKDARREDRPERTRFLEGINKKSASQKTRALIKANELYDYILVGPEKAFDEITAPGLSGKKVKPHFRRGHRHTVSYGRVRELKRIEMFPPVIINAHLIGSAEGYSIVPKNYQIK
jgi:hypothetical protein